jgi:hypothetical protein
MKESPRLTRRKEVERAAEEARLAEALRENLRRRKEQQRAEALTRKESRVNEPERGG